MDHSINVGIGFATGRKTFRDVARTYAENWYESGLAKDDTIRLNLFVGYDLKYKNTKPSDYTSLDQRITEILEHPYFIGDSVMTQEAAVLVSMGIVSKYEAELLFGDGYGKKRNAIMYFALKNGMDYLLFIDDDEYPLASYKTPQGVVWKGQQVLATHMKHIKNAGITHGHHCGYVSPIPQITFNTVLREEDFQLFIETISNDIISWDSIRRKMLDGGITYCSDQKLSEVPEINGAKFISGSNLFFNLNSSAAEYPFFNPPGARGEDTFLSTCLSDVRVLKVPCYTFHDGFAAYAHLLNGALPTTLKPIQAGDAGIDDRFYRACVGWIRYKPLFVYVTKRAEYASEIEKMRSNLHRVLPKLCRYFRRNDFMRLTEELDMYDADVRKHYDMFEETKSAWQKVVSYLKNRDASYLCKAE